MRRGFSCYLDLVRVLAAGVVFLHHLSLDFGCYVEGRACALVPYHAGHSAVVVFFVLSGYVIAYVAHERERTLLAFGLARAARIYSVAMPVLLLVLGLDAWAWATGQGAGLPAYQYRHVWAYAALALSFTTDHWFLAENAFSLGAWWSVSYEVWYYVLFAALFYLRGWRRWLGGGLVALLMGPKLLAMLPLWLLGWLAYRVHRAQGERRLPGAAPLFVLTLAALALALATSATLPLDAWADAQSGGWISRRLRFSQWFVGDFAIGLAFAANVLAARDVRLSFGRAARPIRFCAAYSFTFYMIHGPVQKLIARDFGAGMLPTALATLAVTVAFGAVTERQKARLRGVLERAARLLQPRRRRAQA